MTSAMVLLALALGAAPAEVPAVVAANLAGKCEALPATTAAMFAVEFPHHRALRNG
jgi:hypothetical protein